MGDATACLGPLMAAVIGPEAAGQVLATIWVPPSLDPGEDGRVTRALCAMALNGVLLHDLLQRVPTGAAYVADRRRAGERIVLDHGALRTINLDGGPVGALPGGHGAFARILQPLGYREAGVYPLERLKMTGRAFAHADLAEDIPQFFVSELHVQRFSPTFQAVARRVFGKSRDPLGPEAWAALDAFAAEGVCEEGLARAALPGLAAAFGRCHPLPSVDDYEDLLRESAEAAWIATEGGAFNHATSRVADVEATAEEQRRLGRPVKDAVEVSASGRVRQTAFRADPVRRALEGPDGPVERQVPGSFYEFISRAPEGPDGALDLRFDSANAQGIFAMTRAGT
jgi:hypothetical protein